MRISGLLCLGIAGVLLAWCIHGCALSSCVVILYLREFSAAR